jgi:hypothetical protein
VEAFRAKSSTKDTTEVCPTCHQALPEELRSDVKVSSSAVRCPYCHESVRPEPDAWVVCASCLARHHASCWRELGSCATCRAARSLPGSKPRRTHVQLALFFLATTVLLVSCGLAIYFRFGIQRFGALAPGRDSILSSDTELFELMRIRGFEQKLKAVATSHAAFLIDDEQFVGPLSPVELAKELKNLRECYRKCHRPDDADRMQRALDDLASGLSVESVVRDRLRGSGNP